MALTPSREVLKLGRESEAYGKAAAHASTVAAEEVGARAGNGTGVATVGDGLSDTLAGDGDESEGEGRDELGEVHCVRRFVR